MDDNDIALSRSKRGGSRVSGTHTAHPASGWPERVETIAAAVFNNESRNI